MIRKVKMEVLSNERIAKDTVQLELRDTIISQIAMPGQFLYIQIPYHTLRRPISIASVDREKEKVIILFKIIGQGTRELANYERGMVLDVLGPSGNGFTWQDLKKSEPILLVGGGIGVPPLYFLARECAAFGIKVKAILGFQHQTYVFYEEAFKEIADTIIVTDDGSYGKAGVVTDWIDNPEMFQRYYTCGPLPMLKAVHRVLPEKEGYLSFEQRMGCGIGACYACVIPTKDNKSTKKICHDGPVFKANEVKL